MNTTQLTPLQTAVIEQLGYDPNDDDPALASMLEDVADHGADAGWPGFTSYTDTCEFTARNRKAVTALVETLADDLGEEPMALVRSFRCLADQAREPGFGGEVGRCLYGTGGTGDGYDLVDNALAWFALEETARQLTDD